MVGHWLWIISLSVFMVIFSVVGFSAFIISLPPNYFEQEQYRTRIKNPFLGLGVRILKNAIGVIVLVFGLVMLIAPGQGVLTVLAGVILCDFPGKRRLERKLIRLPRVLSTINRIRRYYKRPPLVL